MKTLLLAQIASAIKNDNQGTQIYLYFIIRQTNNTALRPVHNG